MERRWQIELLGGVRAVRADRVIARFQTQKIGSLLAYLAYYPQRPHQHEMLIELLWPEAEAGDGRNSLRQSLFLLRHQLEPSGASAGAVLLADRATVRLNPEAITTDVAEFDAALQSARREASAEAQIRSLAAAVELYRGELLPGFFDDWVVQERQWLAERYFAALGELLARLEAAHDLERALEFARQGVRVDPLREETHHELIRLLVAAGHRGAAMRQYEELARLMEEQLGAEPSPEVQAFAAEIRSQVQTADRARPKLASPPAAATPVGNLPFRLTRFFGRKPEIARLRALLQTKGTRLVTLTGPGGSGKTRLALETVGRLRKGWAGGIWFVPLQDLADPQLIPAVVLDSLRVPRAAQVEPLEQLMMVLSDQSRLLVLDNFEHLVSEGAPLVRTLLERVAPLTVLVTSRQRLGLSGEREFPLAPLPVPDLPAPALAREKSEREHDFPTVLIRCPSVQLFVDRAQAVRPEFRVTPANAAAVAGLCARLEGLPLALELAAARIGVLTPEQMLWALEQRFEFLVSRERLVDRRHQSLRAALDGSFRLLSPELQRFFARLSVFRISSGQSRSAREPTAKLGPPSRSASPSPRRSRRRGVSPEG